MVELYRLQIWLIVQSHNKPKHYYHHSISNMTKFVTISHYNKQMVSTYSVKKLAIIGYNGLFAFWVMTILYLYPEWYTPSEADAKTSSVGWNLTTLTEQSCLLSWAMCSTPPTPCSSFFSSHIYTRNTHCKTRKNKPQNNKCYGEFISHYHKQFGLFPFPSLQIVEM